MPTDEAKTKTRGCKQLPPALLPLCPTSYKESSVGATDPGSLEHMEASLQIQKKKANRELVLPSQRTRNSDFSRVEEVRE